MPRPRVPTRLRAWFLRTFAGRRQEETSWTEALPEVTAKRETFALGELTVTAVSHGLRASGINQPSVVYEVSVRTDEPPRAWSSKYGLEVQEESPSRAAQIALGELHLIWSDANGWRSQTFAGMNEDEREAMEDNPDVQADIRAASWVGPALDRAGWRGEPPT